LADEYRVRVRMKGGPFAIEDNAETVLRKESLIFKETPAEK
jgi:hypothetical protein